jgi:hypothetical protein
VPLIPFPNVPNVPGVPAIIRSANFPTPEIAEVGALGALTDLLGFTAPIWGVFDQDGNKVLNPDSFLSMDFKNSSRVSDYPQEQGAFASYNKVVTPYDVRVRMAIGADQASREAFLAQCDAMLKSIDLFNVVTPEATYLNATLENYDYRRETKNGATMLTVDLWFLEVRFTATAEFSSVQSVSGADAVSDGQVQASAVPAQQISVTEIQ